MCSLYLHGFSRALPDQLSVGCFHVIFNAEQMDAILVRVTDPNLQFTLSFGVGLHHAGLQEKDRKLVEELFVNQKIHV